MLHQDAHNCSVPFSLDSCSANLSVQPRQQLAQASIVRRARQRKRFKGQALVEFALVAPVLLALTLGMIQYGIIFNTTIAVSNLSREGARGAAVDFDSEEEDPSTKQKKRQGRKKIKERMEKAAKGTLVDYKDIQNSIAISPDPDSGTVATGTAVTVSVTYPMSKKIFFPKILGATVFGSNYTSTTTMRKE